MDSALASPSPSPSLDIKTLLARVNARLVLLRTWLSHDHHDEPYWWARRMTVQQAQRERLTLRWLANLLHVERATARGRIHSTQFATLDQQRGMLRELENRTCTTIAALAGVPRDATLAQLRDGKLPL
jgi:hypothetical protein